MNAILNNIGQLSIATTRTVSYLEDIEPDGYQFRRYHSELCDPGWGIWQACTAIEFACMSSHPQKQVRRLYSEDTLIAAGLIGINDGEDRSKDANSAADVNNQRRVIELQSTVGVLENEIVRLKQALILCKEQAVEAHRDDAFRTSPR